MFRTTLVVQESSFRRLNSSTISPSRRGRRGGEVQAETVRPCPGAAWPHPEADGVRRECPEFAAPPRMTGLSAPRLGEARALLGTARPRRCLTAAAVRGWAGTLRCRGTPATAGAAGGAGRTRSHECCPSVGAAVRPTAAAMGAESHRTAGSRCSAGTHAAEPPADALRPRRREEDPRRKLPLTPYPPLSFASPRAYCTGTSSTSTPSSPSWCSIASPGWTPRPPPGSAGLPSRRQHLDGGRVAHTPVGPPR